MLNILLVECDNAVSLQDNDLNDTNAEIVKIQYSSSFIYFVKESKPDAIVFSLDSPGEKILSDLHLLDQQHPLPVIMFANDGSNETIAKAIKAEVSAYVVDDLSSRRFFSVIQIAIAQFKHRQTLKDALEEARTQLEDRKQIDRAKAILIKTQNFSEDQAYHTLRKLAMDRNITLGEMARNVIAMAELLK